MDKQGLVVTQKDAVLWVRIDNPARRNALGTGALEEMAALAERIAEDSAIRAVVLTGAGERAFTSGFDLRELAEFDPEAVIRSRFTEVVEMWARLPVPVIGALNGHCMGGGVHLAVACDMLVSVPGVRMMVPAARFGFVYSPQAIPRIARMLGPARAAQLLYLDQELTVEDLAPSGIVRIVARDALLSQAETLAQASARLAPLAVDAMKQMVREPLSPEQSAQLIRRAAYSQDLAEGLDAMAQKRTPQFRGH